MNILRGVRGFDIYISIIGIVKYYNVFIDMRVVSGIWYFFFIWFFFVFLYFDFVFFSLVLFFFFI